MVGNYITCFDLRCFQCLSQYMPLITYVGLRTTEALNITNNNRIIIIIIIRIIIIVYYAMGSRQ